MYYASLQHERLYKNITRGKDYPASALAALYLLTSNRKLWKSYCKTVSNQGIEWTASRNIDCGWDGYNLERAALSFSKPTSQQVPLYDLTNPAEYPWESFKLVVTALAIARFELRTTQNNIRKGEKNIC